MATKKKKSVCRECHNQGYVVARNGQYAYAEVCKCISDCNDCDGEGFILNENEKGYSYLEKCSKCSSIRLRVKRYNKAQIPAKYYKILQADSLIPKDKSHYAALSYAKEVFVDKFPFNRGFILMGPSGVGKTHLAIGTIAELTLKKGVKCMFKDFFFLLNELKKAYSYGVAENDIINPLVETEVLVIDELGKGKSNEWELNILDQLISKRYNSSKKTLITTNYISKDKLSKEHRTTEILEDRIGERISSRLYEMCELYLLEGRDYRKENSANQ